MKSHSDPVEFDCEGCGMHVISFDVDSVPKHGMCTECAWLCEFVPDPTEMMTVRRFLAGAKEAG
jgi:hypothetical protein